MQAGGTIYASDYASVYVKALFSSSDVAYTGEEQTIQATVTDASLQAFVGKTSVSITYDLGEWTDVLAIPTGATVLLRGTYLSSGTQRVNQPIAFVVPHGAGGSCSPRFIARRERRRTRSPSCGTIYLP